MLLRTAAASALFVINESPISRAKQESDFFWLGNRLQIDDSSVIYHATEDIYPRLPNHQLRSELND